jgi:hypothetical protein
MPARTCHAMGHPHPDSRGGWDRNGNVAAITQVNDREVSMRPVCTCRWRRYANQAFGARRWKVCGSDGVPRRKARRRCG